MNQTLERAVMPHYARSQALMPHYARSPGALVLCSAQPSGSEAGPRSSLVLVSGKSERQAARSVVADYHDVQLHELVHHVGHAIDRYRAGELDAYEMDRVLFQYSRAAKELWKFCNSVQVDLAAAMIRDQPQIEWWERGAPHER